MAEALMTKTLKEMRYSYYCVTPKNHRFLFVHENIKKHCHKKKVIVCFNNLGEENF